MLLLLLLTMYTNDSQQVIYIFYWTCVKINTQWLRFKKCKTQRLLPINWLLTNNKSSENWCTKGLLTGYYYASLGYKLAYFYATKHVKIIENTGYQRFLRPDKRSRNLGLVVVSSVYNPGLALTFHRGAQRKLLDRYSSSYLYYSPIGRLLVTGGR